MYICQAYLFYYCRSICLEFISVKVLVICHNVLGAFVLLENGTRERATVWVDPTGFIQHERNFRIIEFPGLREAKLSIYNQYLERSWINTVRQYIKDSIWKLRCSLLAVNMNWFPLSNAELFFIIKVGMNYSFEIAWEAKVLRWWTNW